MRFSVAVAVIVVAAGMATVPYLAARTSQVGEDTMIKDVDAQEAMEDSEPNASQAPLLTLPEKVSVSVSGQTPTISSSPTSVSATLNTTSNESPIPYKATAIPEPLNNSTAPVVLQPTNTASSNISSGTDVPLPMAVPMITNASSATVSSESKRPTRSMDISTNAPRLTNVSAGQIDLQRPESVTNYIQTRGVPQSASIEQGSCPDRDRESQQNRDSTKTLMELMKGLETLTQMYNRFPGELDVLDDDVEDTPEDNTGVMQNPLAHLKMCTLITKIGNERGPITVLVTAEDEERMRASGSFYQVGNVLPERQRAFTSYCPGREDLYLTFNPSKK